MAMRPILSSVTLVALILTFLFVGCAKEEPPPPTAEAPAAACCPAASASYSSTCSCPWTIN